MPDAPLVSIVTPCYNHARYLDDYFRGLLAQTYSNVELIISDDGSTDDSWARITMWEGRVRSKFPRVVIDRHENVGAAANIHSALQKATGDFVCILDSDDYYMPDKIGENVRFLLDNPDYGAVHSDTDYIYADRIELMHWSTIGRVIPQGCVYDALLEDNFIMMCSFCCRMAVLRRHVDLMRYVRKGYVAADYAMFLDIARHTKIGYIDRSLGRYRVLENSLSHSSNPRRTFEFLKNYYKLKLDYIREHGAEEATRNLALTRYHLLLLTSGYELYLPDEFSRGYAWLAEREPRQLKTIPNAIRSLAMSHPALWSASRALARLLHECRGAWRRRVAGVGG